MVQTSQGQAAPRYQQGRPKDVHTATPWHRYGHHIRSLRRLIESLAADLRLPAGGRLLDYGCADLPYRDLFPPECDYVPADLAGNPAASVALNPDGTVPAEDQSFDGVLSTQVLEHVTDPAVYLSECFRVLRPGGRMLLSTHGIFAYHPDPDDYWRWTCAGLRRIVEDAGFAIERFEGAIGLGATGLQLFQDAFYYYLPRRLRPVFAFGMQALIRLVDRVGRQHPTRYDAQIFALVARKP